MFLKNKTKEERERIKERLKAIRMGVTRAQMEQKIKYMKGPLKHKADKLYKKIDENKAVKKLIEKGSKAVIKNTIMREEGIKLKDKDIKIKDEDFKQAQKITNKPKEST